MNHGLKNNDHSFKHFFLLSKGLQNYSKLLLPTGVTRSDTRLFIRVLLEASLYVVFMRTSNLASPPPITDLFNAVQYSGFI